MMKAIIRTDASVQIGSGHVMRCLTVANELTKLGYSITFIMHSLQGSLEELARQHGYAVIMLDYGEEFNWEEDLRSVIEAIEENDYDLCIIDHYQIDMKWETGIRQCIKNIMIIDDLANRSHDCDLLLDQNFVDNFENRYNGLVPDTCELLLGPKYLILREEFTRLRSNVKPRNGAVNRLLVFMGGSDPTGETLKIMKAMKNPSSEFQHIDVVVGQGNPCKVFIEKSCIQNGYQYHVQINYLAELIAKADFAIGAGGSTTWERFYLGLPSSSTIVAENQLESTIMAGNHNLIWNLGWHEKVTSDTYRLVLEKLSKSKNQLFEMSENGLAFTNNPTGPHPWIERILEIG